MINKTQKKVFLVVGSTGQYSDLSVWNVAAYPTREEAERHALLASEEAKKEDVKNKERANPYDKCFDIDTLTGIQYIVEEIPFVVHVDQYLEECPS